MKEINKDKLKWFTKYNYKNQKVLFEGEEYLLEIVNPVACFIRILNKKYQSTLIQTNEPEFKEVKLILKKLKDITEEELSNIQRIHNVSTFRKEIFMYIYETNDLKCKTFNFIHEIDYLRENQYAINIPKEYFIIK